MEDAQKAVILLSGGLDSSTTLAMAGHQGFSCYALTFQYGQRHAAEIEAAKKVALALGAIEHRIMNINLADFGGSALTDHNILIPKNRSDLSENIPITYVPARNTIFLSYAVAWAEVLGIFDIFIGVNAIDYSGYPDCRPAFIKAFEHVANLATAASAKGKGIFKIHTPVINMTKAEIIIEGTRLGLDYSLTHSCYNPDQNGLACGVCDSCQLRKKGFKDAHLTDPISYNTPN